MENCRLIRPPQAASRKNTRPVAPQGFVGFQNVSIFQQERGVEDRNALLLYDDHDGCVYLKRLVLRKVAFDSAVDAEVQFTILEVIASESVE